MPPRNLAERINPSHTALLVIDLQNDFCSEGGWLSHREGGIRWLQQSIPVIVKLVEAARAVEVMVVFIRSHYDKKYLREPLEELLGDSSYPLEGTWGAEFCGVRPQEGEAIITKHTYDAFIRTELDALLQHKGIRTVVISGVLSNVCVECTTRTAFLLGYHTVTVADAVGYRRSNLHNAFLENASRYFGKVVQAREILDAWNLPR